MSPTKILYLITEDWYFWSHRLPIARAARDAGFEVLIATRVGQHRERIEAEGFKLIPIGLERKSRNIFREITSIFEIVKIYRKEKPDIVHHVAMKPVLYGSIAACIVGVHHVVNALAGLGYVFTSRNIIAQFLRFFIVKLFQFLLNREGSRLILQNDNDCFLLTQSCRTDKEKICLIRGSGVDTTVFHPFPKFSGIPVVILASRMLWDKGVGDFVEAVRLLKKRQVVARFVLVGDTDLHNPNAVPRLALQEWSSAGIVEWWGKKEDMADVFARATIFCLPSFYGEGVPKVLLEAAACGLPIITTDTPGCRDVVRNEENGLLVPIQSVPDLANALQRLVKDPELCRRMGVIGREIVLKEFAVEKVVAQTLALYEKTLSL